MFWLRNKKIIFPLCTLLSLFVVALNAHMGFVCGPGFVIYSKMCVKRPIKNRQNKDRNDKW